MNFNINKLRDTVRNVNVNVPNLNELRSTLSTGLNNVRENVTTNAPRITEGLRAKLGYTPAPTEDTSSLESSSTVSSLSAPSSVRTTRMTTRDVEAQQEQGVLAGVREEVRISSAVVKNIVPLTAGQVAPCQYARRNSRLLHSFFAG